MTSLRMSRHDKWHSRWNKLTMHFRHALKNKCVCFISMLFSVFFETLDVQIYHASQVDERIFEYLYRIRLKMLVPFFTLVRTNWLWQKNYTRYNILYNWGTVDDLIEQLFRNYEWFRNFKIFLSQSPRQPLKCMQFIYKPSKIHILSHDNLLIRSGCLNC